MGDAAILLLIRHGVTDWNREDRVQGQSDIPLNSEGWQQAAILAERLVAEGVPVAAVYSSHLSRAAETARLVAAAFGLTVAVDPRLRERNSGVAEGLCRHEVEMRFGGGERRALDFGKGAGGRALAGPSEPYG